MTSRMIVRLDHARGFCSLAKRTGWRSIATRNFSGRVSFVPSPIEQRVQQAHRVARVAVADGLDVGVLVGVDRAGDRDALRVVDAVVGRGHGEDRLAVRAHSSPRRCETFGSEPLWRQRCSSLLVPSAPAASTTLRGVERAPVPAQPGAGALGRDRVAVGAVARAERADVDDLALGHHAAAALLGEPEVVLDERVLRPEGAADHAAPAADAAGAVGPVAAEERVGDGRAGRAEEHADAGLRVGLVGADVAAELAQQVIGRVVGRGRS